MFYVLWVHYYDCLLLLMKKILLFLFGQVTSKDNAGEEGQSNTNVFCRLCCVGENEGSEKARKMLSCKTCSKKYHRTCLKNWSQNRGTV